jgi:D-amino-acid dehydrogenase
VHVPAGAHCLDPGGYVARIVQAAQKRGAMLIRARALDFKFSGDDLVAVETDQGPVACDRAVISAGMASSPLARLVGDRVPLAAERGYHVEVRTPEAAPHVPLMPSDGKMANTATLTGLRAAGQVEIALADAPANWARADVLLAHLQTTWPALPAQIEPSRVTRWMGCRPSTPDGLPVIGRSARFAGIVHAFGHGHVGLAAGPKTAALVADLVLSDRNDDYGSAWGPARFR